MNKLLALTASDFPIFKFYEGGSVLDVIANIINFLLSLAAVLAVLFIVWGGVQYVISSGSPEKTESAKKTIYNAVIGTVIIILALVILNTVKKVLGS